MSSLGPIFSRTTPLLLSDSLNRSLQQTQKKLFEAQEQISTGRAVA